MSSTRRVLIFSFAYYPHVGGAEVAIKEITDRLPDFSFDLITFNFNGLVSSEKVGNITVYRISSFSKYLFPLKSFLFGLSLHRKNKYNIVWSVMANTGFAALFLRLFYKNLKFVLTIQEGDPISRIKKRVWFVYPLFRLIFKKADVVTAISTYLSDFAKSMGARDVEILPNGVDLNKFKVQSKKLKYTKDGKTTLITTGRLVKKNALDDTIKALKFLPSNFIFKSIGGGEELYTLEELANKLGVRSRVEFVDYLPHDRMIGNMSQADIFIRPSLSEGLGNSFIEAMALGLPIIGTPVGGIPDFLQDGETGLFCKIRDPKNIAEKILTLVNEEKLYEKLSKNGRELVEKKYDWNKVAKNFKALCLRRNPL